MLEQSWKVEEVNFAPVGIGFVSLFDDVVWCCTVMLCLTVTWGLFWEMLFPVTLGESKWHFQTPIGCFFDIVSSISWKWPFQNCIGKINNYA